MSAGTVTDVSKDHTAFVFKAKQSKCIVSTGLLDSEYDGTTIFEISVSVNQPTRLGIAVVLCPQGFVGGLANCEKRL